jgi:hypothetical protein
MDDSIKLDRRFAIIDDWILDLNVSDRAIRLYAILSRYADNETHKAYPSRVTLAKRLQCSASSVDRATRELIEAGALDKKQRLNSSLIYTLRVLSPVTRGVVTSAKGGSSPVTRGVVTSDDLTRTTELEPFELEPHNDIKELFSNFYSVYPRRVGKESAKRAFLKASKRVDPEAIVVAAEKLAGDPNLPEKQFIPHPATWLNRDGWEDEPYPAIESRKTNSQRNIENLREKMKLLEEGGE